MESVIHIATPQSTISVGHFARNGDLSSQSKTNEVSS